METRRQAKVAKLLQRELAIILQKNTRIWFSIPFISVSQVKITPDLSYAKVYLTFIDETEPEEKVEAIKVKIPEIKRLLANQLRHELRKFPAINFYYDDTLDYADHMNKLLDSLNTDQKGGEEAE